jgi:hypothetical protein
MATNKLQQERKQISPKNKNKKLNQAGKNTQQQPLNTLTQVPHTTHATVPHPSF